jgi:hypothetical protein
MDSKNQDLNKPSSLSIEEIRSYVDWYNVLETNREKLSVSLIQRRFLLGYYAATQIYGFILETENAEHDKD